MENECFSNNLAYKFKFSQILLLNRDNLQTSYLCGKCIFTVTFAPTSTELDIAVS